MRDRTFPKNITVPIQHLDYKYITTLHDELFVRGFKSVYKILNNICDF